MDVDVKPPVSKDGIVINSADPNDFTCYICPGRSDDSLETHLTDDSHRQRFVSYILFFTEVGSHVRCKFCQETIEFFEIIDHALGHHMPLWYVPEDCPEILFKNFISPRDHQYFCHLCDVKIPFWYLVEYHNEEVSHTARRKDKIDQSLLENFSSSIAYYKLTTNNSIFMKTSKMLTCSLCACDVGMSYEGIITHIEGKSHKKREARHIEALKSAETYQLPLKLLKEAENCLNSLDNIPIQFLEQNKQSSTSNVPRSRTSTHQRIGESPVVHPSTSTSPPASERPNKSSAKSRVPEEKTHQKKKKKKREKVKNLPVGIIPLADGTYRCSLCSMPGTQEFFMKWRDVKNHSKDPYHQARVSHLSADEVNNFSDAECPTSTENVPSNCGPLESSNHPPGGRPVDKNIETLCHQRKVESLPVPPTETLVKISMSEEVPEQSAGEFPLLGEEVYFTECGFCYHQICGGHQAINEHINSRAHKECKAGLTSGPQAANPEWAREPQLNDTNDTKYFILRSSESPRENISTILKVPKGTPTNEGQVFNWCRTCEIKLPEGSTPDEHLKSCLHEDNLREKSGGNERPLDDVITEEKDVNEKSLPGIFRMINSVVCAICDNRKFSSYNEAVEHAQGWTHRNRLWNLSEDHLNGLSLDDSLKTPEGIEPIPQAKFLLCTICNCQVRRNYVNTHTNNVDHLENGEKIISRISTDGFQCDICNCIITGHKNVRIHLKDNDHLKKRRLKALKESSSGVVDQQLPEGIIKTEGVDKFWCLLCDQRIQGSERSITRHITKRSHEKNKLEQEAKPRSEGVPDKSVEASSAGITASTNGEEDNSDEPMDDNQCSGAQLDSTTSTAAWDVTPPGMTHKMYNETIRSRDCSLDHVKDPAHVLHSPKLPVLQQDDTTQVMPEESKNITSKNLKIKDNTDDKSQRTDEGSLQIDEDIGLKSEAMETPPLLDDQVTESSFTGEHLPEGIQRCYSNSRKESSLICTICVCPLAEFTRVEDHVASVSHQSNGENVIIQLEIGRFKCEVCDRFVARTSKKLLKHLKGEPHRRKVRLKEAGASVGVETPELPENIVRLTNDNTFWCSLCSCVIPGTLGDANAHVSGQAHQEQLASMEQDPLSREPVQNSSTEVSQRSSRQTMDNNTTTPSMISSFQLDNQEDNPPSAASRGEFEDHRKILPQSVRNVACEICNCMIPGGNWNVNAHRMSREHLDNEARINSASERHANGGKEDIISPRFDQQEFSLSDIPPEMMLEYHYVGDIIDCIECKVCDLKIRETRHTPATLEYLQHSNCQEHKENEIIFVESWISSKRNSYAAKASMPQNKVSAKVNMKFMNRPGKEPKIPCRMCKKKFKDQGQLHGHMTEHLWRRFSRFAAAEVGEPGEEVSDVKENGETEAMQLREDEEPEDLEFEDQKLSDSPKDEENLEVKDNNLTDSPKTVGKNSSTQFRKKPLDIELDNKLDIYEIHEQRKEDIKLGVLLSFPIDKDNIYCLVCRKSVKNSLQNFYEHLSSANHLDYLQEMMEDHQKFKNYPRQLSDLALAHEYMQEISDDEVQCHACGVLISNDSPKLRHHIHNQPHGKKWSSLGSKATEIFNALHSRMESNFYNARKYWCVLCKQSWIVELEFRRHLNKQEHKRNVRRFNNEIMIFDYCASCATLWYGFLKTFSHHTTCKMHKNLVISNDFLITELPQSAKRLLYAAEGKIQEILARVDARRIDNKRKEDQVIRSLEKISKEVYPSAKAYPFGSRISGLGGKNSDLDIFLDCSTRRYPVYTGENSSDEQVLVRLKNIKNCLEKDPINWNISRDVQKCRIPIIKVTHRSTDIDCDISFTNGLTVENTKVINAYCDNYPDCRRLIIFVKNWMGYCELSGYNGIVSYGIAWLVIYFLQVISILPTISQLTDMTKDSRIVGGWETHVVTDFQARTNGNTFSQLLTQFFKFYANFDYRNLVICPLLGKPIEKKLFLNAKKLPSQMKLYLDYLNQTGRPEPFRVDSILCLQDPFDLAHNITKAVKKFTVYRFKTFCSLSAQILDNNS